MNEHVISVPHDMPVHNLARFLVERMISGAPVADRHGRLVGVVSHTDIARSQGRNVGVASDRAGLDYFVRGWEGRVDPEDVRRLHIEEDDGLRVRDIMTPRVYEVAEDTPLARVADTMLRGHIHRLLVTRSGRVTGIVSTMDLLKVMASPGGKNLRRVTVSG